MAGLLTIKVGLKSGLSSSSTAALGVTKFKKFSATFFVRSHLVVPLSPTYMFNKLRLARTACLSSSLSAALDVTNFTTIITGCILITLFNVRKVISYSVCCLQSVPP